MLMEFLAGLEGSALAAALRVSKWVYPLVNAGHIAGIALLFGTIAAFDFRLMGAWRRVPLDTLYRVLVPVAAIGLVLAASFGSLLFIVKAREYAAAPLFQTKMLMLAIGLANVLAYHVVARRRGWLSHSQAVAAPAPLQRLLGAVSFGVWLSVLVLGRLVGYF
jgi:hypothetical protein